MDKIELNNRVAWFDSFAFAAKARKTKLTRFDTGFDLVLVNPDSIVGTDGQRLHITHSQHPFEVGLYNVIKLTKTKLIALKTNIEQHFPKYEPVIPHHQNLITGFDDITLIEKVLASLGQHCISINHSYLCPLAELDVHWQLYYGQPEQPVRFISEYNNYSKRWFEAVIMPIAIDWVNIKHITKSLYKRQIA